MPSLRPQDKSGLGASRLTLNPKPDTLNPHNLKLPTKGVVNGGAGAWGFSLAYLIKSSCQPGFRV